MKIDEYRKAMLDAEPSSRFLEDLATKVMSAEECGKNADDVERRRGKPSSRESSLLLRRGYCLAAAVLAIALFLLPVIPKAATAFMPKYNADRIVVSFDKVLNEEDSVVVVTRAKLVLPCLSNGSFEMRDDSPQLVFCDVAQPNRITQREGLTSSSTVTLKKSEANILIGVNENESSLGSTAYGQLRSDDVESESARVYQGMRATIESLRNVQLSFLDEGSGETYIFFLDVDELESRWDYQTCLHKGGPIVVNLEQSE